MRYRTVQSKPESCSSFEEYKLYTIEFYEAKNIGYDEKNITPEVFYNALLNRISMLSRQQLNTKKSRNKTANKDIYDKKIEKAKQMVNYLINEYPQYFI